MVGQIRKKKEDPTIYCLQETHFRLKYTQRLKVKEWENIFHASGNQKKVKLDILISDKTNFKPKMATRDKGY